MLNQMRAALLGAKCVARFLRSVLPRIDRELDRWQAYAAANMRGELQKQALASIAAKRFHCQGGGFYALYPGANAAALIPFIVALQTISDYLDNLCDRGGVYDAAAFRQLHRAMEDALDPDAAPRDYYAAYPLKDDSGYLAALVAACQGALRNLPAYRRVKPEMLRLAALYSQLQTHKHRAAADREAAMLAWLETARDQPELSPWEFAAATGSTLGLFILAAAASRPDFARADARRIAAAYFPWICGLHIQLDYLIDQEEDRQSGDLNFVAYYASAAETVERLDLFYRRALQRAAATPHPFFATLIARGLPALYLSDPKPANREIRAALLRRADFFTAALYRLCRLLRRRAVLR